MGLMRGSILILALGMVSSCGWLQPDSTPGDGIHDPSEAMNRQVHQFNLMVDDKMFRGDGPSIAEAVPRPVYEVTGNVAETLSLPGVVVNDVLQGKLNEATRNSVRLIVNATMGLGGLMDVAADMGLPEDETDFGETLAVWGVSEGGYVVLPIYGPSNDRDVVGQVVDLLINPIAYVVSVPASFVGPVLELVDDVGDRQIYGDTYDSVLHESADSYKQMRLIYLQNRRYELGEEAVGEDIDPLELDTKGF
ncbi:phospholipid-binding lipoprotein MlaA [Pelagimonas varians]|uniref:Putative phospholipid-binding lipoprotein MlaA n=2 Tax=Pelagimonas varians TaxID=696760 RepID=A0A238KLV9_9RHOB|nr:phospholipid-binding lipoprotein MlaA [Pelagimonas varians]SMX43795.1 putative phospholipid-binding lipoprotein MlaA precursor [Pelagimonas varians]